MQRTITESKNLLIDLFYYSQKELDNPSLIFENTVKSVQVTMEESCQPPNYLAPKFCISRDTAYV